MPCPICDDRIHKTIIPTAEGYDLLIWLKKNVDFFIGVVTQQHVPVGQISQSSVHIQSAEQFGNMVQYPEFLF